MRNIPYSHQFIDREDIKEVIKVLKSDWLTQGPKIKEFEGAFCKYTGAKYAVCVSSGTAALHIACLAAGMKRGNRVITSPITFVSSANCILYCGGRAVFADVQEDTANIAPEEIKKKITKKTQAIIPVHFAGHPCDLIEIHQIAKRYDLVVIEDACHSLGAAYKAKGKWLTVGSCKHSDMTVFSFHPVKSITTGEGGVVSTNRKDLYEKLLMFRNHGITKESSKFKAHLQGQTGRNPKFLKGGYYEMQSLGYNYRLTDIQCALGISQLKKLDKSIKKRREIAEIYTQVFRDNEYFDLPEEKDCVKSSWHLYSIKLKNRYKKKREKIFRKLRQKGVGVQIHYIPVYWQPYYQQLGYRKGICPQAEDFYQREISIPLYPSMSDEDLNYVIENIFECFQENSSLRSSYSRRQYCRTPLHCPAVTVSY